MRTNLRRMWLLAALVLPAAMLGFVVAPAGASAATTCTGNSGSIKLSPGLQQSAHVQNITIKGTLSGCTGSTVTGASYVAHLKTTNAVSCTALESAGEAATGSIVIKWSPHGQGNSNGTFSMPLTDAAAVNIGGTLEGGPFPGATLSGTVSQAYAGACTTGSGKKSKKIKSGTFTGSAVEIS
jgi:hypothetical protein